ncbi:unnamed protein product [Chrysodeixis includens]|uniref:Uncharacterized protein n=1 Tax=Chrysodeixis includens TaxID=689277 RepID=A0A9P0FWF4_CHRIL|nr:unnamed protein product [Chrysodeixis includens]
MSLRRGINSLPRAHRGPAPSTMEGNTRSAIFLIIVALSNMTSALEARKVLNIPEKIIGGVIDIVQNHKNKPSQQTAFQIQGQQQNYQGYPQQYAPWNNGYQLQGSQYQGQYANYYGYPQSGQNYGGYVNSQGYPNGQYVGPQSQGQNQYQNYPGNQFQAQNQQNSVFEGQYQNQVQNQQSQVQGQNQYQNQQSGQFVSQNQQTNVHYQGAQQGGQQPNYPSQPSGGFVAPAQPTGSYGGQQTTQFVTQQTSTGGQVQQTSHFQGQSGNQSVGPGPATGPQNGSFQISSGHQSGGPGPTCVCQAWTKPQPGAQSDAPSQRNEESEKKPE